jgi:MFS family permease
MGDLSSAVAAGPPPGPWYQGVTRAQWLVLAIASAGWVFDVFEGQLFGSLMNRMMPMLLTGAGLPADRDTREFFVYVGIGAFLGGGALGGVLFGMLADRWGRRWTMAVTIAIYSVFTGVSALAQDVWQLTALRFLVGLGVGGEWAVAAAAVAEMFPPRARTAASGIFHASSVLGTYLAVAAGLFVNLFAADVGWRVGFLLGIVPALLILWIRVGMAEPDSWREARERATADRTQKLGRLSELFSAGDLRRHTLLATALAVIGLATFWGAHFRGKDVLRGAAHLELPDQGRTLDRDELDRYLNQYEMLGMFLVTTGGGVGLLSFAPLSQRFGRRGAFLLFHLGGFALVGVVALVAQSLPALLVALPVFGFFTLGMHAGYAIYFPELFPTRLRGTGAGFCFNVARCVVIPVLLLFAWLQRWWPGDVGLARAMLVLGGLFLVGALLLVWCPETRGRPLPE